MLRSAMEPSALQTPRVRWEEELQNLERDSNQHKHPQKHTHQQAVPGFLSVQSPRLDAGRGGVGVCFKWLGLRRGPSSSSSSSNTVTRMLVLLCVSPSLGFLLWVPLLLQALGIALSHGVDDGNDKVADHDQHHLLKHPGQPVLILETQN